MSDINHYRYGNRSEVLTAVDAATVIESGDLVWQDTDNAKPASAFVFKCVPTAPPAPRDICERLLPELFADKFLGVAMQRSRGPEPIDYVRPGDPIEGPLYPGETDPIRVATTGVFEFDVLAGECFELGDLIGVSCYDKSGHYGLQNQQVTKVAQLEPAIGRVAKFEHEELSTTVLVDIRSRVMGR